MILSNQLSELTLLTGVDIPFPAARVTIHQPRMKEIGLIGEDKFLIGLELLKFTKKKLLSEEEQKKLAQFDDFFIFMQILLDKAKAVENKSECAYLFLQLIFPIYRLTFSLEEIAFFELEGEQQIGSINTKNFAEFQDLLKQLFDFKDKEANANFNPSGDMAKRIAKKLEERQRKLAAQHANSGNNKIAIYSRYISILAVGQHKDINSFADYTVFQLLDEFARYKLKVAYDIYFKSRLAGASSSDLKEPEDWMKDLYP